MLHLPTAEAARQLRKAKDLIDDFIADGNAHTSASLSAFGLALLKAHEAWRSHWKGGHCAVCGAELKEGDLNPNHFNRVCAEHRSYGTHFDLEVSLSLDGLAPPVPPPDFWEGCEQTA